MVFADLFFLYCFLPLCLICYFIAKKLKTKNLVLIIFSLVFYAWGEPLYVLLLLFSAAMNWFMGLRIGQNRDTKKGKIMLGVTIAVNIGCRVVEHVRLLVVASEHDARQGRHVGDVDFAVVVHVALHLRATHNQRVGCLR